MLAQDNEFRRTWQPVAVVASVLERVLNMRDNLRFSKRVLGDGHFVLWVGAGQCWVRDGLRAGAVTGDWRRRDRERERYSQKQCDEGEEVEVRVRAGPLFLLRSLP